MEPSVKIYYSIILLLFFYFFSCQKESAQKIADKDSVASEVKEVFTDHLIDTVKLGIRFDPSGNYEQIKQRIRTKRNEYKESFTAAETEEEKQLILDSARIYFTDKLLNDIIPHWYGTVWDFDGYTNVPNHGVIACGYFISTTLKHMGVNLNRYKFAQQAGLNEAKSISPNNDFKVFSVNTREEADSVLTKIEEEFPSGLYTVGLSNHVGYIYIKNKTAYFIHSNYIDGFVMTEKARYSDAFFSFFTVITDVTFNDFLIQSWIMNEEITVITE